MRTTTPIAAMATAALALATLPAQAATVPGLAEVVLDPDALQGVLDGWRGDVGAFGATLSLRVPGQDDLHLASGVDDRDPETPMPTDGTFPIDRVTMNFVAAIVMQLVDEGRVEPSAMRTSSWVASRSPSMVGVGSVDSSSGWSTSHASSSSAERPTPSAACGALASSCGSGCRATGRR